MRLAGDNPLSGFSFEVTNAGDGNVTLNMFRIKEEKIKTPVTGHMGDTLQTPVGKVIIYPVESENEFKHPIRISWANSMAMAKAYANKLNLSLSGKESSVVVISMNDIVYVEPNEIKARQSTIDDKGLRLTSILVSSGSLLVSVATLLVNLLR